MTKYSGTFTLQAQLQNAAAGTWALSPGPPTIGTATVASATSATVTFTAPANIGSSPITSYTVTSSPGNITASGASSPITVSGLTTGTTYTFTVRATNLAGTGPASAASNSVTPTSIFDNFLLHLEGQNWNGTTWTATKGTNPTKNGTISASTINGFPCALFGSNGYFTIPNFVAPSSLAVFAVINEASGAPFIVEQSTNANSTNGFYFYSDNNFPYAVYRSTVGTLLAFNPTNTGADWYGTGFGLGATNFDGSNFTLRKNSTNISASVAIGSVSSYATSSNTTDTLYIGARAGSTIFFNGGSLCELIISPSLSAGDFNFVASYLTTKYGL